MPGRRWLYALTLVLAIEMAFTALVLVAEVRTDHAGAPSGFGRLVWLAVGLLVAAAFALVLLRARRELDLRAQSLDAAATTSHDWLWECGVDDTITYSNAAVTELLGYEPAELVGRHSFDLLYDEAARQGATTYRDVDNRPVSGWDDVEMRWRHRDGSPVRLIGSAAPLHDHRGQVVGYRGTRRLVTDGQHSREAVRDARTRISGLLTTGEVDVALQPIVHLATGDVIGAEALARFADGRGPDAWFRDAHLAGRTHDLDELTFTTALALLARLPEPAYLSVNASPDLMMDLEFRGRLLKHPTALDRLVIEITEHARVGDYAELNAALAPLRERGVRFAIDDTGAGYASLSHVLRLKPDIIKLDRELLTHLDTDRARRSLITALVLLALDIGANVTGEGVETPDQLEALSTLGVDQAQGYLLARPSTDPSAWDEWWSGRLTEAHLRT